MKTLILLTADEWLKKEGLFSAHVAWPDARISTGTRRVDIEEAIQLATEGMITHYSKHMKMASQRLQGIQASTAHEQLPSPQPPTERQP